MKVKRRVEKPFDIDMTPMIDMVFLLLIFFMCASSMSKLDYTAEVQLPKASMAASAKDQEGRGVINLLPVDALTKTGERVSVEKPFLVYGRLVDAQALVDVIGAGEKGKAIHEIYLRIDRQTPFSQVRQALKACADAGISDLIFATDPTD